MNMIDDQFEDTKYYMAIQLALHVIFFTVPFTMQIHVTGNPNLVKYLNISCLVSTFRSMLKERIQLND